VDLELEVPHLKVRCLVCFDFSSFSWIALRWSLEALAFDESLEMLPHTPYETLRSLLAIVGLGISSAVLVASRQCR